MMLSLAIVIITFILANSFYEPLVLEDEENKKEDEALSIKDSFKFILSSRRLKSLLLYSSIMLSLIYILASSEIYLIEELELSSSYIGIIFAILGIISGIAAQKQDKISKNIQKQNLNYTRINNKLKLYNIMYRIFIKTTNYTNINNYTNLIWI